MSLEETEHRLVPKLIAQNMHLKDLITDLADALEQHEAAADFLGTGKQCRDLLQRAREATR